MNKVCGERKKKINKKYSEALLQMAWTMFSASDLKRGVTDSTQEPPTHTNTAKLSRATNCILMMFQPHFHACVFKITSIGVVWVLNTDTIPFS